jgi:hypothetical protein
VPACNCNTAVLIKLKALGHDALTMEKFTVFELIVVEEAFWDIGICFLRSPYII